MGTSSTAYADTVTTRTDAYLAAVERCLDCLPRAVAMYGDEGFEDVARLLAERESTCDERLRALRSTLRSADPNFTHAYLRASDLAALFDSVDEVPNAAEAFVRDLDAMAPALADDTQRAFAAVAADTVRATELLTGAVRTYVGAMVTPGPTPAIAEPVERVAALETECDEHRRAVCRRAFAGGPTPQALVVRELAQSLDAVPDAAEDAGDRLLFLRDGDR